MPRRKRYGAFNKTPHLKRRTNPNRYRSSLPARACVENGIMTWELPRKLRSVNQIRTGWSRHSDTKAWERILLAAVQNLSGDSSMPSPAMTRMRIEYYRLAPHERYFLDPENIYTKGLTDALKRLGWIEDDSVTWLDKPEPCQMLSPDKKYWTIIKLSVAVEKPKVEQWSFTANAASIASAMKRNGRRSPLTSSSLVPPLARNAMPNGASEDYPPRPRVIILRKRSRSSKPR